MADTARGPCETCEHVRTGSSVARLTLEILTERDRPAVRPTLTGKVADEDAASADFADERDGNRRHGTTMYSARPTTAGFSYCGVYEFSNTYACCETKNHELECSQFTPKRVDSAVHDCATCLHQQRVSPRVDLALRQFLHASATGRQLLETSVEPARAAAAEREYGDCVDGAGFVHAKPAFLPWCAALSTTDQPESRYLVGPVVNAAHRCGTWSPRSNPEFADVDTHLDALTARPKRLFDLRILLQRRREQLAAPGAASRQGGPVGQDPTAVDRAALDVDFCDRLRQAEANAQGDLIAFCLQQRGAAREHITEVCNSWTSRPWTPDAPFDDTYGLLDGAITDAPVAATFIGAIPIAAIAEATPPSEPAPPEPAPPEPAPAQPVVVQPVVGPPVVVPPVVVPPVPFPVVPMVSYRHPADLGVGFLLVADAQRALLVYAAQGSLVPVDLRTFPYATWTQLQTPAGRQPLSLFVQLPIVVQAVWLDPSLPERAGPDSRP